jgi:hypothetical protein
MRINFSFNSAINDLWEIYEVIQNFYPIGVDKQIKGTYFDYKGIKELQKSIIENINDEVSFQNNWVSFCDEIENSVQLKIIGHTYGLSPSYSSCVQVKYLQIENCIYTQELYFSISLLGNFFQIYGIDKTYIIEANSPKGYFASNVVTTSPFLEYKEIFEQVESKIREKYPSHKLIPYAFGKSFINGLEVTYCDNKNCDVFTALFNNYLNNHEEFMVRGDRYYGIDDWRTRNLQV